MHRLLVGIGLAWLGLTLAGATVAQAAPTADRDRDKLLDDLEARLDRLADHQRVGVIVRVAGAASEARVGAVERAVGGFSLKRRFRIVDAFAATVSKRQARALARLSDVVQVEEDSPVQALNESAQSSVGVTQARLEVPGLDGDLDGDPAAYSKDDLVAAVIDTGIDPGHADLDGGKVIAFKDFVAGETTAYDDDGHGSHVAGTIAGAGDSLVGDGKGVAPGAALVGVKVLDAQGQGTESDVIAGIQWVVDNRTVHGIEAINLSLGSAGCSSGTEADSTAVNKAHDVGLVVAVAAGNEGPGTCTIGSPGSASKALTVGAMADMDQGGFFQAYFSSRGKTADGRIKPDVSAPGLNITSAKANTANGHETMSGTSMATPFVAGVALLMREVLPALTSQQVKDKLMQTAEDWGRGGDNRTAGSSGPDIDYGAGRLDAYGALAAAGAPLTSPPVRPGHDLLEGSLSGAGDLDAHQLSVTDTQFPVAATLIMPTHSGGSSPTPDFDLSLLDPNGNEVEVSEFTTRQEEVGFEPAIAGVYTLQVRSFSGSGPYFVDVSAGLAPDTTPPVATIASGPSGRTRDPTPTFAFTSDDPPSTFECKVDDGSFAPCVSPHTRGPLADGVHTFAVRATDAAANLGVPASRSFTVDTDAPDVALTSPSGGTTTSDTTPTIGGRAGTAAGDSPTVAVNVYRGTSASGTPVVSASKAAPAGTWSLEPSTRLAEGTYTARAEQEDAAGNRGLSTSVTFRIALPAPPAPLGWAIRPRERDLSAALVNGVPVLAGCGVACTARTTLRVSDRTASRLRLAAVGVGSASTIFSRPGARRLGTPLTRRTRDRVRLLGSVWLNAAVDISAGRRRLSTSPRGLSLRRHTLGRAVEFGIRHWLSCSSACRAIANLYISRRQARALGLSAPGGRRLAGSGSASLGGLGSTPLTVRLTRAVRRRVGRVRTLRGTLRVLVRDSSGVRRPAAMGVTLRR